MHVVTANLLQQPVGQPIVQNELNLDRQLACQLEKIFFVHMAMSAKPGNRTECGAAVNTQRLGLLQQPFIQRHIGVMLFFTDVKRKQVHDRVPNGHVGSNAIDDERRCRRVRSLSPTSDETTSQSTGETTSHSTRLPKDGSQVAGSPPEGESDAVSLRDARVNCAAI